MKSLVEKQTGKNNFDDTSKTPQW